MREQLPTTYDMANAGHYDIDQARGHQESTVKLFTNIMTRAFPRTMKALDWTKVSTGGEIVGHQTAIKDSWTKYHSTLHTVSVVCAVDQLFVGPESRWRQMVLAALYHDYQHSHGRYTDDINIFHAMFNFVETDSLDKGELHLHGTVAASSFCEDIGMDSQAADVNGYKALRKWLLDVAVLIAGTRFPHGPAIGPDVTLLRKADVTSLLRPDWYETSFLGLFSELKAGALPNITPQEYLLNQANFLTSVLSTHCDEAELKIARDRLRAAEEVLSKPPAPEPFTIDIKRLFTFPIPTGGHSYQELLFARVVGVGDLGITILPADGIIADVPHQNGTQSLKEGDLAFFDAVGRLATDHALMKSMIADQVTP